MTCPSSCVILRTCGVHRGYHGGGNFDHWVEVVSGRFSDIQWQFSPSHTLFFGDKSLSQAHSEEERKSYLEFQKEVLGSQALMLDLSWWGVRLLFQLSCLRFSSYKIRRFMKCLPGFAQLGSPVLRPWLGQWTLQLDGWVSSHSPCYEYGLR